MQIANIKIIIFLIKFNMIDDCAKPLIPNLKSFCCLRHLIEMSKVCEERMISHKYYKYILRFFHKYSQISPKSNVSSTNSLPLTLALLSIMSKCISYFYSVSKISFSKRQLIMLKRNRLLYQRPIISFCHIIFFLL